MDTDAFLASLSLVTFAEIGDKTQLLSLMLAARYRRALPIIAGIFVATALNHLLAALAGQWAGSLLESDALRWGISLAFIALGLWALVPDRLEEKQARRERGVFVTSALLFFLAEMGDKTQLATAVLAAEYGDLAAVVTGTTLGMLAANIPAVLMGEALLARLPLRVMRLIAAVLFIGFGVWGMAALLRA